jgi:peptidoglycan/xylan/chitin deacetylase (PgdA/CDA1 family)
MLDRFKEQVQGLAERYEMAALDDAITFLEGRQRAARDLCLLTFDDGLAEHYAEVTPFLKQHKIQGVFFPATSCLEGRVATVHKIHFLMAALEFDDYREAFLTRLGELSSDTRVDPPSDEVRRMYPWDPPEVGALKYLANFTLNPVLRDRVVADLFESRFGDEAAFAGDLYLTWDQLREMQRDGMIVGGHSHAHSALAGMAPADQRSDLTRCVALLRDRLLPQRIWPFAYPYGRFDAATVTVLRDLGFSCSFTVESGTNAEHHDLFRLRRFDTNQISLSAASRTAVH